MKSKITKNLTIKILCLLMSFVLWVVVMNIEDPSNTRTFNMIPVVFKNESIINDAGKTFELPEDEQYINVKIKAKRSVLKKITPSDIEAVADFKDMEVEKLVPIKIRIINFEGEYELAEPDPKNIEVRLVKTTQDNVESETDESNK